MKEISLQLDPGKLIVNDAAYGPSDEDVPKINQQTVGQFDFKALSSIKINSRWARQAIYFCSLVLDLLFVSNKVRKMSEDSEVGNEVYEEDDRSDLMDESGVDI